MKSILYLEIFYYFFLVISYICLFFDVICFIAYIEHCIKEKKILSSNEDEYIKCANFYTIAGAVSIFMSIFAKMME